jgi:hypothetical protein
MKKNSLDPMEVVLAVVDSEYPSDIEVQELRDNKDLLESAIKLAEKNGLYYHFINQLREQKVDIPVGDRWSKEEQRLASLRKTIMLLNKVLEEYEIDYTIIKECNAVPHIPRDIDIFVAIEDKERVIKALEDNGMECVHSGDIETTLIKDGCIDLDVYTRIDYFTVEFMDKESIFKTLVKNETFGVMYPSLSKEMDFLLIIIHALFGHGRMSLLDFLQLKTFLKDNIQGINSCRKYAYEHRWGAVFDLILDELNSFYRKIYEDGEVIQFPYLFKGNFFLRCVSLIEGINMNWSKKIILYVSLLWDRINFQVSGSLLYKFLRSIGPARRAINSLGYWIRYTRGDRYS